MLVYWCKPAQVIAAANILADVTLQPSAELYQLVAASDVIPTELAAVHEYNLLRLDYELQVNGTYKQYLYM